MKQTSYQKMRQDPEKVKKYRAYHRAYDKKWRKNNPKYLKSHREQVREWYKKNYKKIYERRRQRPYEKIAATMRSRMNDFAKRGWGSEKTEGLLGCTFKELEIYLEKKFKAGMSLDNYGFYGWHIDHIKALCSFNLNNPEERKRAWHYTNLQPLWAKENLHKHKNSQLSNVK